ncbi:MAG: PaaI family thioesterase [Thermoanaerobaculia bacterium]|nr:PaaI family thioesterase [Thermoanaerobaculia bacterium]
MSGLEVLQAILDGEWTFPSMAKTLPMQLVEFSRGRVVMAGTADERHLNPAGGVHGGFYAVLLDSVLGNAVGTELSAGDSYTTVDLNIKMLAPMPLGEEVIAEGLVIKVSRSVGAAQGTVRDARGKVLAHGTTTCYIRRSRA